MQLTYYRLSHVIETRANNFDLLRLIAALAVMFGHSFWIQPAAGRAEPLLDFMGIEYSGSLAVYTFFLISGMLISASYARQQSAFRFAALRVGRIYPAFFICVLLSAYLIYPLAARVDIIASLPNGFSSRYFIQYAKFFVPVDRNMPHIFENTGIPHVMNGSLWTLPVEGMCYGIVLVAGLLSAGRRAAYLIACGIAAIGFGWLVYHPPGSAILGAIATKANAYSFYPAAFFIAGMALYTLRDRVKVTAPVAACLVAYYLALRNTPLAAPMLYVALTYGVLWAASTKTLHRLRPKVDLSYGVYLWAFPLQQMVATMYPAMDNLLGLAISVPLTLLVAALSWFLVEKPAMSVTRRITTRGSIVSRVAIRPAPVNS